MKPMRLLTGKLTIIVALGMLMSLIGGPMAAGPVSAGEEELSGNITTAVDSDVKLIGNATIQSPNGSVNGNIDLNGWILEVRGPVNGNIEGEGIGRASLQGGTVDGNIKHKGAGASNLSVSHSAPTGSMNGNIELEGT